MGLNISCIVILKELTAKGYVYQIINTIKLILLAVFPRIEHERNMKVNTGIKFGIFSVFLQKKEGSFTLIRFSFIEAVIIQVEAASF